MIDSENRFFTCCRFIAVPAFILNHFGRPWSAKGAPLSAAWAPYGLRMTHPEAAWAQHERPKPFKMKRGTAKNRQQPQEFDNSFKKITFKFRISLNKRMIDVGHGNKRANFGACRSMSL